MDYFLGFLKFGKFKSLLPVADNNGDVLITLKRIEMDNGQLHGVFVPNTDAYMQGMSNKLTAVLKTGKQNAIILKEPILKAITGSLDINRTAIKETVIGDIIEGAVYLRSPYLFVQFVDSS